MKKKMLLKEDSLIAEEKVSGTQCINVTRIMVSSPTVKVGKEWMYTNR